MKTENSHITVKVLLGYALLIVIGVFSVVYLYNAVRKIVGEEEPDNKSRLKAYLVTNTLSLIYESEALAQIMQPGKNDYNKSLDNAQKNMDSLRILTTDSLQLLKIDTISRLLERKRINTRQLAKTLNSMNTDYFLTRKIERVTSVNDTITIEKYSEIQQDTLLLPQKKKNFFQRLAHVFAPAQTDTAVVINSSREILTDTLGYSPSEAIANTLREISDSIAGQRRYASNLLSVRMTQLQFDNNLITGKINQLLHDIETEEMEISYERIAEKQQTLQETSRLIIFYAALTLLVMGIFLFLIIKDISRSNYYRVKLEESKQDTENLLQAREKIMLMLSHDIRSPLSSISGYIELMQRLQPNERQQYYLNNITSSSQQILSLVNNLLDAYRLESGKMEIHKMPFGIMPLFNEIYTNFKPLTDAKGLYFQMKINEHTKELYTIDPILIKQIVNNLLSNAVKFTHEGAVSLDVNLFPASNAEKLLQINVTDTGPGIPEKEQEKIFGDFKRLEQNRPVEGFGLGLSITGKLVRLLNGEISLKSAQGKGSVFTVVLPLEKAQTNKQLFEKSQEKENAIKVVKTRHIHCLVIDDDPLQLALMNDLLQQHDISCVTCANDPSKITELLHNGAFDVVFTDISMPVTDGYQVLCLIRNSGIPKTHILPVVALTGFTDKDSAFYKSKGFADFLNKPFYSSQLLSLLHEIFGFEISTKADLNFSSLTAFAENDKASSLSILQTFLEETRKNTLQFKQIAETHDVEEASILAHKMLPIFTMLEAGELIALFRQIEKNENLSETTWREIISQIIKLLESTLLELNQFLCDKIAE